MERGSASMILIKNNVPSPSYLGSTNGLVQWFMCLSRCISAAFARQVDDSSSVGINFFSTPLIPFGLVLRLRFQQSMAYWGVIFGLFYMLRSR
jgi:hypothetical protein